MNTQKKLSRLAMVVSLVAFGMGFGLAKNTAMGTTGITMDLPQGIALKTTKKANTMSVVGKTTDDVVVVAYSKQDPPLKNLNIHDIFYTQMIAQLMNAMFPNAKIIKQDKLILNNVEFEEIQLTTSDSSGNNGAYFYLINTIIDDKMLFISIGSPIKSLKKNRDAIAHIVGSIKVK
jgi:hypothetical protein